MKKALSVLLLLYVVALHTSIAAMEILSWLVGVLGAWQFVGHHGVVGLKSFLGRYRFPLFVSAGLVGWVLLSLLSSPFERPFLDQFGFMRWTILLPLMTFALLEVWDKAFERRLVVTWISSVAVVAVYGIAQFLTGVDLIRPGSNTVKPQGGGIFKAVGFFSMSLTYAYVFGQSAVASLKLLSVRVPVWATALFAVLSFGGVVASMSRGAWLGSILTFGIFVLIEKRKWILPYIIGASLVLFASSKLEDAIGSKLQQMAHFEMDSSSGKRVDIWKGYVAMIKDNPIVGVGLFDGDRLVTKYYEKIGLNQTFASHAHNNSLQWLAGTGVPGFLLFAALCIWFLLRTWELRKVTPWAWALLLAHIYWQLGGLTECNFFDGEVNHFIIFGWALTWALHYQKFGNKT